MTTPVSKCTLLAEVGNWPSNWQMTSFIKNNTTPEEFDRERAKYPGHQLIHGPGCRLTVLAAAAEMGNTPLLKHILGIADKTLLNTGDIDSRTPLYFAVEYNRIETVKELINQKADINLSTKNWVTPLKTAAEKGHQTMIKLLLKNGAAIATCSEAPTLSDCARQKIEQVQKEIQDENVRFIAALDEGTKVVMTMPKDVLGIIYEYAPFEEYTSPLSTSVTESSPYHFMTSIARMLRLT